MTICPVGAELFHADRQTDRHDEANSRFLQICEPIKRQFPIVSSYALTIIK
jgi:hypothetical protein